MAKIGFEDVVNAWKSKKIKNVADIDVALSDYRILFAYTHSNEPNIRKRAITITTVDDTIEKRSCAT